MKHSVDSLNVARGILIGRLAALLDHSFALWMMTIALHPARRSRLLIAPGCCATALVLIACGSEPPVDEWRADAGSPEVDAGTHLAIDSGPGVTDSAATGERDSAFTVDSSAEPTDGPVGLAPHARRVSLVDHTIWTRVAEDDDLFGDRPASVYCDEISAAPELLSGVVAFGVDTGGCNYVTVREPSRDYVAAGETLSVRLAHFALTAPSNSEAHLVVRLDDVVLLEERIPIPSAGAVLNRDVTAPRDIPIGAPLYFHVHNHGDNSYALATVTTGP